MRELKYLQFFRGIEPLKLLRFLPAPNSYRRYGGGLHGGLDEEYKTSRRQAVSHLTKDLETALS